MSTQIYQGGMRIVDASDKKIIRHSRLMLEIMMGLGLSALLAILINAVYPYKTISFLEPIEIQEPVYAGETLYYRLHFIKHIDRPAKISRSLVNERTITYTAYSNNLEPGEHNRTFFLSVPREVRPGHHHLEITWEYRINPLRAVTVKKMSKEFNVLPPRINYKYLYQGDPHKSPPMLEVGDRGIME